MPWKTTINIAKYIFIGLGVIAVGIAMYKAYQWYSRQQPTLEEHIVCDSPTCIEDSTANSPAEIFVDLGFCYNLIFLFFAFCSIIFFLLKLGSIILRYHWYH